MKPGIQFVLVDFGGTGIKGQDLDPKEVVACAAALNVQAQQHVALPPPYGWGVSATVRAAAGAYDVHPDEFILALLAQLDESGALGYHDLGGKGAGFAKICPPLDLDDGSAWSQTASHEMLEIMGDFDCTEAMQGPDGKFWAKELCDPCEAAPYYIDGVAMSDFVLPAWFTGKSTAKNWLGTIHNALELLPGGYAQYYDPATGWQQVYSQLAQPRAYRLKHMGRRQLRQAATTRHP